MRVLIVKLSSFGDLIHTFPAVTDLAAERPAIEVDWLVEEDLAPIARLHPAVGAVHAVALRRLRWPPAGWPALIGESLALRRTLHSRRYAVVIDLQGLVKSALLARLAGAPVAGYDRASAREPAAAALYQRRFAVEKGLHAIERSRRLAAAALDLPPPRGEGDFGLAPSAGLPPIAGLPRRFGVVLHMASWPTKLWPEDNWRQLLAKLAAERQPMVLPWGNAEERARAERLAAGLPGMVVLPRVVTGAELAGLIGAAEFAVGLDSGLMHLANALKVPGVWLYGPTDPALSGPYGDGQRVVRSRHPAAPCRQRRCSREPGGQCCMRAVALDEVAAAVEATLGKATPRPL